MKRKIKFKGKTKEKNVWVYGFYYNLENKESYIMTESPLGLIHCEVRPETVSQFTGLLDDNDREIYENDRVFVGSKNFSGGSLYTVSWRNGGWIGISDEVDSYGQVYTRTLSRSMDTIKIKGNKFEEHE